MKRGGLGRIQWLEYGEHTRCPSRISRLSEPIQSWLHAEKRSMKEDVYPDDIKAIPVKRLSAAQQEPFVRLEKERHGLWRELVALEEEGFRIGARIEIPVRALAERFRREHPEIEHLGLLKLPASLVELEETALERDLNGARAMGSEVRVRRETVARAGDAVQQKEQVAVLLARLFGNLPGPLAGVSIELPRSERGLLALASFLNEQEESIRHRQARIAEIQREIDQLAWALYRPASAG